MLKNYINKSFCLFLSMLGLLGSISIEISMSLVSLLCAINIIYAGDNGGGEGYPAGGYKRLTRGAVDYMPGSMQVIQRGDDLLTASYRSQDTELQCLMYNPAFSPLEHTASNPSSFSQEENILGQDRREHVPNPQIWPHRPQGYIETIVNDQSFFGSGVMISPYHVLTCAHSAYTKDPNNFKAITSINFHYISSNRSVTFSHIPVVGIFSYGTWLNNLNHNDDLAVLVLGEPIGKTIGYYGLACLCDSDIRKIKANVTGYPGEVEHRGQMWTMSGKLKSEPERLQYDIDTTAGQSGGPIWTNINGAPHVLGVHTVGDRSGNTGVRLSKEKFDWIVETVSRHYEPVRQETDFERALRMNQSRKIKPEVREAFIAGGISEKALDILTKYHSTRPFNLMSSLHIRTIRFWRYCIGPEGKEKRQEHARAVLEMVSRMTDLEEISCYDCWSDDYMPVLVTVLPALLRLRRLYICNTSVFRKSSKVSDVGAKILADTLPSLLSLSTLYLAGNNIGEEGRQALLNKKLPRCTIIFDSKTNEKTKTQERQASQTQILLSDARFQEDQDDKAEALLPQRTAPDISSNLFRE